MAIVWTFRDRYFIRSACKKYNVSKCFIVDVPSYEAWFTERPANDFCRAEPIGNAHGSVTDAMLDCETHFKSNN